MRFKEGALSRIQCYLKIDEQSGVWTIEDGNGKDKLSTNGTWFWVS